MINKSRLKLSLVTFLLIYNSAYGVEENKPENKLEVNQTLSNNTALKEKNVLEQSNDEERLQSNEAAQEEQNDLEQTTEEELKANEEPSDINLPETEGENINKGKDTGLIGTVTPDISKKGKNPFTVQEEIDIQNYTRVTLIDVILETVSQNYNIKTAREKVRQAQLKLDDAYSGYKPTLDMEYKNGTTEKTPGDDGIDSGTNRFHDETFTLKFKQNLYAGGATENKIKGLEKSLLVAKNRYELAISKEIQNAIKAYFGVVFSYQSLYATRINMEMLQKILEIVTIKYDLGATTIGDISSIKASVSNAQSKLSKTNSKFVEALRYYEYVVGEKFQYTLPYEYEFKFEVEPLENLLIRANKQNLNIVSYLLTVESEKFKLKEAESAFKPKIDLELTHTKTYDKDIAPEDFYRQNTNEAYVTFKYNLYNGDKDSNKLLSVYSTIREVKYKIEEERRKIKWIISNLHQSLNALTSSISSIKQEVESSQVTVESYWEAFKNGEQDLQTLLSAQRQLNSAQVSLIESYQNRLNDYFKLLFESGQLVEHFNLDPSKDNFIDFTRGTYNPKSAVKKEDIDLIALASMFEKEQKLAQESQDKARVDTLEDILIFKDKFLDANDEYYTIYIGEFDTIYDTFGFIKNNQLSKKAFMVDILNDYKLKNIMAYGIYENIDKANEELSKLAFNQNKEYKVVSIEEIKGLYKKFINGFDELRPKELVETKIIKMAPKSPEPYFTNEVFKEMFTNAKKSSYTINVVTFSKLDDAIALVNEENIYDNTLMFRYGTNAEWIKVVYGVFETYEEAALALSKLSAKTKERYFPVIEFIKDKQLLYNKYKDLPLGRPQHYRSKLEYEAISQETTVELKEGLSTFEKVNKKTSKQKELEKEEIEEKKSKKEKDEAKKLVSEEVDPQEVISQEEEAFKKEEAMSENKEKNNEPILQKNTLPKEELKMQEQEPSDEADKIKGSFKQRFMNAPTTKYTLNLATFSTQEASQNYINMNDINKQAFAFTFGEDIQYSKIMYGIFDSYKGAQEFVKQLPKELQKNNPRAERIYIKQDLFNKYHGHEPLEDETNSEDGIKENR